MSRRAAAFALAIGVLALQSATTLWTVSAQSTGLLAAYAFDEGTGTTTQDFSGNGNSGVLVNGATWTAGFSGNAASFDGVASKISLPSALDIAALPFTLEAWVRPANYSGWHAIFSKRNSYSSTGMRFDVGLADGTGRVYVTTAGTTVTASYAPLINQWTHLAVVATASSTQLYVNGTLQQTMAAITLGSAAAAAVGIGRTGDNDDPFAGAIDDLRLYNRALSVSEVQTDMGTPVQLPGPHLSITQPAAGSTISGSTVNVSYVTSGDLTEVNHVHFQLDSNPEVMDLTLDGVFQFANVSAGNHTLLGYLVRADHSAIAGTSTTVAFTTTTPDVTPPSAPSNLTATANGGQVALSWTAATDNVGVTVYRVERCQGTGCSGFSEIGTATTTSYLDIGLLATTSYTYRVRAGDAAGLLGPYSGQMSVTTGSVVLTGLLAAYGFDEGTGTTTLDASGRGYSGSLVNGATWTAGRSGTGVAYNGSTAKISLPSTLDIPGLPFTLEAWVKPADFSDWHVIFSKRNTYLSSGMRVDVGLAATTGRVYVTNGASIFTSTYAPPVNTWTHLAIAADSTSTRLFVNGTLRETLPVAAIGTSAGAAVGVGRTGDNQDAFSGVIDELRLYSRALTSGEIQNDMNTPVSTPGPPDTTPPTVSMTAPAPGATISGVVNLTVNASDNVGVAGVQYLLDNTNIGAEVQTAPFTLSWNSATAAPGQHTLAATARDFSNNTTTTTAITVTVQSAADSMGAWSAVSNWPLVAIHAALLPTGDVLAVSNYSTDGGVQLWRPSTNTFTLKTYSAINLFCMANTFLADGRLFTAGGTIGTSDDSGPHNSTIFNPATGTWTAGPLMAAGRYYPTATTLGDGRVLVQGGTKTCATCIADLPEIYDPATNSWNSMAPSARMAFKYYPHPFLLPDGRIVVVGQDDQATDTKVLNLTTQSWTTVDARVFDGHSSVMYAPGKILKAGTATADSPGHPSAATSYVLDMTAPSPAWQPTATPMAFPRSFLNLTVLPDGQVLATGGGVTTTPDDFSSAVYNAELWSPVTKTWTTMAPMQTPRLYHSTALLLPDARVLVAGGGRAVGASSGEFPRPEDQPSAEIYSPPYLFKGPRPVITAAPSVIQYATAFSVATPDSARIASVSLIPLGAVTHAFNENQRFVPLAFAAGVSSLQVTGPVNGNTAPPGPYMLFIVDSNGVPSVAAMVRLPGPGEVITNTPPTISALAPQTVAEDTSTGALNVTVGDAETAPGSLALSGATSNATLVPIGNITFGGTGSARTVTVTPAANQSGTATITVTVSDGQAVASTSFLLTVTAVNDPPTISSVSPQTTSAGVPIGPLSVTVGDAESVPGSLTLSGSSSNKTLVPDANITFGGSGAARTVTVTPAAGQTGNTTITMTVSDGQATASTSFVVTVTASNTPPTISALGPQTIVEDASTGPVNVTVGDAETAPSSLTLSGGTSNAALVPVGNITFGGSGSARTVTVTPAANQSGTATVTVTVSDGQATASTSFLLTVTAVNDTPTISSVAPQTTTSGVAVGPLPVTVGDVETAAGSLTLSGSSSNTTLVPVANISFGGSGSARTVTVTPVAGQTGTATITVTVSDGQATASTSFLLTVNAIPSGLAVALGFNEGTGTATFDSSGSGNSGTLANGATWTAGHAGNAVGFNGTTAKVALPSTLDIAALPFTLEAWVRPTNYSQWRVIFSKRNSYSAAGMRFDVGLWQSNGRVYVTTSQSTVISTYAPPLNAWTHLAVVADSTSTRLYVNGVLQQTLGTITLGTAANAAVNVGLTGDNDDAFLGAIDDLRVYRRALSVAEIQADMNTPVQ